MNGQRLTVEAEAAGLRLDSWLTSQLEDMSRVRVQALIREGAILLNGKRVKPNHKLSDDDRVSVTIPDAVPVGELHPEDIPLDILYEDDDLIVINKQAGMVVHPAVGNWSGTLVNALLHHCPDLPGIGGELRPGIVHRLDKDTSGALVAAKSATAMTGLSEAFKNRKVFKEYLAAVWGRPERGKGRIETLIGRDPRNRKKMAVVNRNGREAITNYEIESECAPVCVIRARIETGRTHQIRVHLSHIGHPVVGDPLYCRKRHYQLPFVPDRQMLHAEHLGFVHPCTQRKLDIHAPIAEDMAQFLKGIEDDN